jgi:hypothetical protein
VSRQRGQASVEVVGLLPILLLFAMLIWQMHLAQSAATAVENAARTASRVESLGGDGKRAVLRALPKSQREGVDIEIRGATVRVRTEVPTVVPGLTTGLFHVRGSAELP